MARSVIWTAPAGRQYHGPPIFASVTVPPDNLTTTRHKVRGTRGRGGIRPGVFAPPGRWPLALLKVDRVLLQVFQADVIERALMRGVQHDARRAAGLKRFAPARGAQ